MYLKDKTVRIYARVSEKHYTQLQEICEQYNYNTSEAIRLLIDCYTTLKGANNENKQADFDN